MVQANGTATFTLATLPAGSDSITAVYSGDPFYATSASSPVTELVGPDDTRHHFDAIWTSVALGTSVTLTATVAGAAGAQAPTGTVRLSLRTGGSTVLGVAT